MRSKTQGHRQKTNLFGDEAAGLAHRQRRLQAVALAGGQEGQQRLRLVLRIQLHLRTGSCEYKPADVIVSSLRLAGGQEGQRHLRLVLRIQLCLSTTRWCGGLGIGFTKDASTRLAAGEKGHCFICKYIKSSHIQQRSRPVLCAPPWTSAERTTALQLSGRGVEVLSRQRQTSVTKQPAGLLLQLQRLFRCQAAVKRRQTMCHRNSLQDYCCSCSACSAVKLLSRRRQTRCHRNSLQDYCCSCSACSAVKLLSSGVNQGVTKQPAGLLLQLQRLFRCQASVKRRQTRCHSNSLQDYCCSCSACSAVKLLSSGVKQRFTEQPAGLLLQLQRLFRCQAAVRWRQINIV